MEDIYFSGYPKLIEIKININNFVTQFIEGELKKNFMKIFYQI